MDSIFLKNFILFSTLMLLCLSGMGFIIAVGNRDVAVSDSWVRHTYDVIVASEEFANQVEGILASQRGYIITADEEFLKRYDDKKSAISNHLAKLRELTKDSASQQSRLDEIRSYVTSFTLKLEERAHMEEAFNNKEFLAGVESVDNLKKNILRVNSDLLAEEYKMLNTRIQQTDFQRKEYISKLIVGGTVCSIILLMLNGFLLHTQSRRSRAERNLKATEERLTLAIEGTNDGIFDWDIKNGKVFYSAQFFKMLGYNREAFTGTIEDLKELLHPDDAARFWEHIEHYLHGELSEYSNSFRMKAHNGRWVWINARAKALFDKNGKPERMVGAHTDITYMKQYEERLKDEKDIAEKANQAKTDFLAHMSHEIRTPLTAISGIAEIFSKGKENFTEKHKKLVGTLSTSAETLKDLINDILDFSKIEAGDLELDMEDFALNRLFEQAISIISVKANEKNLSFVFDYSEVKDQYLTGDPQRLRQILINLIGNALKFTDEGGITVKAYHTDKDGADFLRIDITDTGIGIAPENLEVIFERFKQADSSVSRRFGGTGLGLPISKNLAKIMGGDIIVSSKSGDGSTFSLLIPFITPESTTGEKGTTTEKVKQSKPKEKISLKDGKSVLLVEDYEGNIVVISYILDDMGCAYDIAKTGAEALKLWQEKRYDVVLMDVQMPEMDGFTATAEIRKAEKEKNLSHTPIIGMTAHALIGDKDKCIQAGMDAYLPKPIVESDLKKQIFRFLDKNKKAA